MTTIFVHRSAAESPDAATHLTHLPDAGHELVLVTDDARDAAATASWHRTVRAIPEDAPRGSWYLTADPATCGDRRPGVRTVLIGPREEGPRPTRCDGTARDLRDAVLEILTADAMA